MMKALNNTGRHIVYSCEWPMYEKAQGGKVGPRRRHPNVGFLACKGEAWPFILL